MPSAKRIPKLNRHRVLSRTGPPHLRIQFKDRFEAELARVLDFWKIRWEYEPRLFPLLQEGDRLAEAFSPDFYLPAHDQYIELTTSKKELMQVKKRKIRLVQSLYPHVKVRLLARRDYHQFLAHFAAAPSEIRNISSGEIKEVMITSARLHRRVRALATRISKDYAGKSLIVIGILKGSLFFMSDLVRLLSVPYAIDYVQLSRPDPERHSRRIKLLRDLDMSIKDRHVLIIDDIISTGLSMSWLLGELSKRAPASISTCVLLDRPHRRLVSYRPTYIGFEIPNEYVIGYGLDYRELYRDLDFIAILQLEAYAVTLPHKSPTISG